jgi:Recombinase zinc beta ribbon domain/Recombinase
VAGPSDTGLVSEVDFNEVLTGPLAAAANVIVSTEPLAALLANIRPGVRVGVLSAGLAERPYELWLLERHVAAMLDAETGVLWDARLTSEKFGLPEILPELYAIVGVEPGERGLGGNAAPRYLPAIREVLAGKKTWTGAHVHSSVRTLVAKQRDAIDARAEQLRGGGRANASTTAMLLQQLQPRTTSAAAYVTADVMRAGDKYELREVHADVGGRRLDAVGEAASIKLLGEMVALAPGRYIGVIEWNRSEKMYRKGTKVRKDREPHEWLRVEVPHLRIVSDELWTAAQSQMRKNNVGVTPRGDKKKGGRPPSYLLTGITRCAVCGGPLTAINGREGEKPIKVYACAYRRDRGESVCSNKLRRPVEDVNAAVLRWVEANVFTEELLLESLKKVRTRLAKRVKEVVSDMPQLEGRAAKLRAEIANIVDLMAVTPKAEAGHLLAAMHERHEELTALDTRINATKAAPETILFEVRRMEEEARKLIADLRTAAAMEPTKARALLERIFDGKLTGEPRRDRGRLSLPDGGHRVVGPHAGPGRRGGYAKTLPQICVPSGKQRLVHRISGLFSRTFRDGLGA